jgi:hypothetical protein
MPLREKPGPYQTQASWPGLTRPSILKKVFAQMMDARVKPAHDEIRVRDDPGSAAPRFAKGYALRCVRGTQI